jgi:SAM-dependent methyltransferase
MIEKEWFAEWFDTPYYHILYKSRDEKEAKDFIERLVNELRLDRTSNVLDLACGKGRHSITLRELGFIVLGVDLSANSIETANKSSKDGLRFAVQDMREPINEKFDHIFNLFTSFGYFDEISDNERVIRAIHQMLKDEGLVVIDFMNAARVIERLVPHEMKTEEGISFEIDRHTDGKHIYKRIRFCADGKDHDHTERVQALLLSDFQRLLESNGFEILRTFGDFKLNDFNESESDRLIIVARKKDETSHNN